MKIFLVGHRGVGKSSLAKRLQQYFQKNGQEIPLFDLDREIELFTHQKIQEIFEESGEVKFRQLEQQVYLQICGYNDFILVLGAGFDLSLLPQENDNDVIWVRRPSDRLGRIFFDRPRLNSDVSSLEEYQSRFAKRQEAFIQTSSWAYDMPEGLSTLSDIEESIFLHNVEASGGTLTVDEKRFQQIVRQKDKFTNWNLDYFELRDDLLAEQQLQECLELFSAKKILLSFRKKEYSQKLFAAAEAGGLADWALELGACPLQKSSILSVHQREKYETLLNVIERLQSQAQKGQHLKLAVQIKDWQELQQGLEWQSADATYRSFLPRSENGKWQWVRLYLKGRQRLNFLRNFDTQPLDQPTLFQWIATPTCTDRFAAVLGSPVEFSFSPIEHLNFFKEKKIPFWAIDIQAHEWDLALACLSKMGLQFAAVTSPLKKLAYKFAIQRSDSCRAVESANTLTYAKGIWCAENTDLIGFEKLIQTEKIPHPIVIWGGGGTLPIIQKVLEDSYAVSSRTGEAKDVDAQAQSEHMMKNPQTLVWAASPEANVPEKNWNPSYIVDLNYREDSKAREYALHVGARYCSGELMFKAQAQAQRQVWSGQDVRE